MSLDAYGDCRDSCMTYAIEGDYGCMECMEQEAEDQRQEEDEYCFGEGSQG